MIKTFKQFLIESNIKKLFHGTEFGDIKGFKSPVFLTVEKEKIIN